MQPKIITLTALVALFLIAFAGFASAKSFEDVPQTHWAYDAVEYLASKGLVEGYPDGSFQGDKLMTRYELAMIVARAYAKMEQKIDEGGMASIDEEAIMNDLMEEFGSELDEIRNELKANSTKIDDLQRQLEENSKKDAELAGKLENLGSKFKFNGIMKLRADGKYWNPGDTRQHRPRISFRFDMKAPVNDEITFAARLGTGGVGANVASETTLTGEFGIKDFDLERAYIEWKPASYPNWTVYCGKFKPVWATPALFVDPDVNVEGAAVVYNADNWTFNLSGMTPENKGGYVVAQVGAEDILTENLDAYLTYHYASAGAFETLWAGYPWWFRVTDDSYSAVEGYAKYMWKWSEEWPIFVQAAYRHALLNEAPGSLSPLNQAAMAQLTFGEITEVHDYDLWINYGRILPNAIIPQFANSTYGVDHQTIGVGFDYQLMEHTMFQFSYVNAENLNADPDGGWDYWVADIIFDF